MRRVAVLLSGAVQGVGLRPHLARLAKSLRIKGFARNTAAGVAAAFEGEGRDVEALLAELHAMAEVTVALRDELPQGDVAFEIRASEASVEARAALAPDRAPCADCRDEVLSEGARRSGYPFTSCAVCGPRYAIAGRLPWDRALTTMAPFGLCALCAAEHGDPTDRRYYAEALACPACGPRLSLNNRPGELLAEGDAALVGALAALAQGQIVAAQNTAGYQLLVDACDEAAVGRLRTRKNRPDKPFALLFADLDEVRREALVGDEEAALLTSPAAPIVLLCARSLSRLAPSVSRTSPWLGALLPSSPLALLLAQRFGGPLVCTSGNRAGEPLAIRPAQAHADLAEVADVFLENDRAIARPLDDSIVRVSASGPLLLRRARGYAPLSLPRTQPGPRVLALGAHLKVAPCLSSEHELLLGPHVGDLEGPEARARLAQCIDDFYKFGGQTPEIIACDLHPDYATTRLAETIASELSVPLVRVQHHEAHGASVIAEYGLCGPVLAFTWDGAGLGHDGTLWGGEAFVLDGSKVTRVAHLQPFPLLGGERALREPRRSALGLLHVVGAPFDAVQRWFEPSLLDAHAVLLRSGKGLPTTSVGRLFDAVAALVGLCGEASYEGHAALLVEAKALDEADGALVDRYAIPLVSKDKMHVGELRPLVERLLADLARGASDNAIGARFHRALVDWAVCIARSVDVKRVVLSGGCFQNTVLTEGLSAALVAAGFQVFLPRQLPPGDGGIALGQAHLAALRARS